MQWFEIENYPDKKIPLWKRSAGLSSEGVLFVPAAIAQNENEVLLCTKYDGTESVHYLNHVYVPADWLSSEFPNTAEICRAIKESVLKA